MNDKTIKEIAKELNVTPQAIQKKLTPEFRKKYVKKVHGKILINNQGVVLLNPNSNKESQILKQPKQPNKTTITTKTTNQNNQQQPWQDEYIKSLKQQIQDKSHQIAIKDTQINRLHTELDHSQQLQLELQHKLDNKSLNSSGIKENNQQQPVVTTKTTSVNKPWWKFWK